MNSEILLIRSTVFPETFYTYSHQRSSNVFSTIRFKVLPSTSEPQSSSTTAGVAQEQKIMLIHQLRQHQWGLNSTHFVVKKKVSSFKALI
jgi:hypothetical protein